MCRTKKIRTFKHNCASDFKSKLLDVPEGSHVMAVVEGYYSMSGEVAPIESFVEVAEEVRRGGRSDVRLVIDEAHSSGVFNSGVGVWPSPRDTEDTVMASVHAFGKAYGSFGAVACFGSDEIKGESDPHLCARAIASFVPHPSTHLALRRLCAELRQAVHIHHEPAAVAFGELG